MSKGKEIAHAAVAGAGTTLAGGLGTLAGAVGGALIAPKSPDGLSQIGGALIGAAVGGAAATGAALYVAHRVSPSARDGAVGALAGAIVRGAVGVVRRRKSQTWAPISASSPEAVNLVGPPSAVDPRTIAVGALLLVTFRSDAGDLVAADTNVERVVDPLALTPVVGKNTPIPSAWVVTIGGARSGQSSELVSAFFEATHGRSFTLGPEHVTACAGCLADPPAGS